MAAGIASPKFASKKDRGGAVFGGAERENREVTEKSHRPATCPNLQSLG